MPAMVAAALALALAVFALYSTGVSNGFVNWDDDKYVYENPWTIGAGDVPQAFARVVAGNWHPLTMLSLRLDHALWGLDPRGYHLAGIVLHAANSVLVFMIAARLFGASGGAAAAALFAAALFAVHPQHVESVEWVSERKDVLFAFFWLLALAAYLWYLEAATRAQGVRRYLLLMALFALSLMSKPMAVTLPAALVVMDFFPLGRIGSWRDFVRTGIVEKLPLYAMAAALGLATVSVQSHAGAMDVLASLGPLGRALSSGKAVAVYVLKFALPSGLSPLHLHPPEASLSDWRYAGSALAVLGITWGLYALRRRHAFLLAGWAFFLVTVSPTLGLIQVGAQEYADRYMYIPMLGLCVPAAALVRFAWERGRAWRLSAAAAALVVLAVFSVLTFRQVGFWKDSVTLWNHALALDPDNHVASNNLGNAYQDQGDFRRAIDVYEDALRRGGEAKAARWPGNFSEIHYNCAIAYDMAGFADRAADHFGRAFSLNPGNLDAGLNLAGIHVRRGEYDKAVALLKGIVSENLRYAPAYLALGKSYLGAGRPREALESLSMYSSLAGDGEAEARQLTEDAYRMMKEPGPR